MSVITTDYHETLTRILSTLNLVAPWTHNEFIGSVTLNRCRSTWHRDGDGCVVYHITSTDEHLDDVIITIDYAAECHVKLVAPPRKILGYSAPPPAAAVIATSPIYDGSTLKAYFFNGQWMLASRNAVNVNDAAIYTETFGAAFHRLAPELDMRMVYVINLTTTINCPSAGTEDTCHIIEEILVNPENGTIIVTPTPSTDMSKRWGTVYRTSNGIYLDRSDEYVTLTRILYDVPRSILQRLGNNSRKIYVITRAILLGWDEDFGAKYPSLSVDYVSIRDFVTALVRHIFTMCCSRTRNPNSLGSFVYNTANKIGPLKSRNGRNIVVDTLYSKEYIESITYEYMKVMARSQP